MINDTHTALLIPFETRHGASSLTIYNEKTLMYHVHKHVAENMPSRFFDAMLRIQGKRPRVQRHLRKVHTHVKSVQFVIDATFVCRFVHVVAPPPPRRDDRASACRGDYFCGRLHLRFGSTRDLSTSADEARCSEA